MTEFRAPLRMDIDAVLSTEATSWCSDWADWQMTKPDALLAEYCFAASTQRIGRRATNRSFPWDPSASNPICSRFHREYPVPHSAAYWSRPDSPSPIFRDYWLWTVSSSMGNSHRARCSWTLDVESTAIYTAPFGRDSGAATKVVPRGAVCGLFHDHGQRERECQVNQWTESERDEESTST